MVVYFTVNLALVNYLDQLDNLTDTLEAPILMDKTTFEQTLPIFLNASKFESELLTTPKMLKDFVHQYHHEKEIFDLQERHTITDSELPNKISFELFYYRYFSVNYYNKFITGYDLSNVHTM